MTAHPRILLVVSALASASTCADIPVSQPPDFASDPVGANLSEYRLDSDSENISEYAFEIGSNATPVVGGKESAPCGWPSTVDVAGCTGTLIHPRVVTTAAHCISRGASARVTFTAGTGMAGSFNLMSQCTLGARGGAGGVGPRDWAYCVLPEDERVKKIPITPPLVGCEAERYLKAGNKAWVVGFGATGGRANDYGVKREVEVNINRAENGIIDIGDREAGACYGDSGGPLYIKITDGTHDWGWRVAGSTSGAGGNCDCTCSTIYADVRSHVKAIEENEEFDVTPCTDADGKWDPGPECNNLITNPAMGTGTYPDCMVPRTIEPIASCGEPAANGGAAGGGAAGASAGAAGAGAAGAGAAVGAAGTGSVAAGSGAVAAAGSGGSAVGAAGAAGMSQISTAGNAAAVGGASLGMASAAGATAGGSAFGNAGTTGSLTSPATAAGTMAMAAATPTTASAEKSSGCQAAAIGARQSRAWALLGALLLGMSLRGLRSRQRRTA